MPADNLFARALRMVFFGIVMFCLGLAIGGKAKAEALTPWGSLDSSVKNTVPASLQIFKGEGTDLLYPLEVDQTTGALPVEVVGGSTANPAAGPTGSSVPADADYQGLNNGGTLIGAIGDSSGRTIVAGAGTAGTPAGGVLSVQGVSSGIAVTVAQATAANLNATVTGTITANAGTGTFSIAGTGSAGSAATGIATVQGIANMTPILVTPSGSGATEPVNVAQFGGSNVVTGTGTGGSGIPRVTVSSDSTVTANAGTGNFNIVGTGSAGTAATGVVTVQGIAGATAIPVMTTATTAAGTFQDGSIAAGSLTTSYQTVVTTGGAVKIVQMRNNTNGTIVVSLNAGSTTSYILDPGDQVSDDLSINGSSIASSTALEAKYSGSAPTTGSIRINVVY